MQSRATRPGLTKAPGGNMMRLLAARAPSQLLCRGRTALGVRAMAKKGKGKKEAGEEEGGGPYSATVATPTTAFNMRANSVVREPEIQAWWEEKGVYESLVTNNSGAPYTLHDGPPYANGDLHIGHALNKVLKDFINRYQLLRGRKARFVPGWDTHGLPIELKVLQGLPEAERRSLDTLGLRRKAAAYARATVDSQREQFKRYGVWADWSDPYVTLEPGYEAAQLGVFGAMVLRGHIYRGRKPVHWSPSSRTALAEAELEYPEGHVSRSIYVAMPLTALGEAVPADVAPLLEGASLAIWTTTPWTIPANLAVAVNDQLSYAVVEDAGGRRLVVAQGLVEALAAKWGGGGDHLRVLASLPGAALEGCSYKNPLFDRVSPVVVGGDYITTESGTGLVHTAPGHGQEDYQVGQRYGLPLLSPVDDAGNFTAEAGPFAGLNVQGEGNTAVITALSEAGALLLEEAYAHKYPYDWRTKKPTIFRATDQWFASVEGFRGDALAAIEGVSWVPAVGQNRITAMTQGRSDWCISRQRKWGVPIPVFYDAESGEPLLTEESIGHVQAVVAQHGSDAWWELPLEQLLPESLRHLAPSLKKGEDTMDVWFDSGSSWAGVVQARADRGLTFPADLYLEGSDQHRGWFQSSLLTAVAATGQAPYKRVLTHGFVLDERGQKMSKSLGNVVDPRSVIEGGKDAKQQPPYGADVLRLWVASVDYANDVMIGAGILRQVGESYRKLRGTLRFLLGNLADYDPAAHAVPHASLPALDRWMLGRHAALMAEVADAYEGYQFRRVFQAVMTYVSGDLSSFYLDVCKDRLYIQDTDSLSRRGCQTVQAAVLGGLLAALGPLTPHLAEDAWQHLPYARPAASVFGAGWQAVPAEWAAAAGAVSGGDGSDLADPAAWAALMAVRDGVQVALVRAREEKLLGSSLEAAVTLHVGDAGSGDDGSAGSGTDVDLGAWMAGMQAAGNGADQLRYLLVVSEVAVLGSAEEAAGAGPVSQAVTAGGRRVTIGVARAAGAKCARCWNYSPQVGAAGGPDYADLCERCAPLVSARGFRPTPAAPAGEGGNGKAAAAAATAAATA